MFPFDDNGNGFIDVAEFDTFVGCLSGPDSGIGISCENHDADLDGDVDSQDFAQFQIAIAS